jgi:hypothetical protein
MNGVVKVISTPVEAIVGLMVWPSRSVNQIPTAVSVNVYRKTDRPIFFVYVLVAVAVGLTVAPPMLEPPKAASACELMLEKVAWTP